MSASPAPAPTSSAATPTSRARPISASISRRCRSITASSKAPGSIGRASGRSSTTGCNRASTRCRRRPAARRAPARRTWRRRASPRRAGSTRCNLPEDQVDQRSPIKAMMVFGHGGNTVTRIPEAIEGHRASSTSSSSPIRIRRPSRRSMPRKDDTYLLPICTSLEMDGSRTASNRSLQWGEQIVKPAFESKNDYEVDVSAGEEARLRRQDVQEHQGREQRALGRGYPARDQPRRLVDRLLRPVAGAAEGAYEEPGQVRPGHACARRRTIRRSAATITACPGRAGASPRSAIPARLSSTTPTCT